MPSHNNLTETCEYKLLRRMTDAPILRYQTNLGNKTIIDISTDKQLWPLLEIDYKLDLQVIMLWPFTKFVPPLCHDLRESRWILAATRFLTNFIADFGTHFTNLKKMDQLMNVDCACIKQVAIVHNYFAYFFGDLIISLLKQEYEYIGVEIIPIHLRTALMSFTSTQSLSSSLEKNHSPSLFNFFGIMALSSSLVIIFLFVFVAIVILLCTKISI